MPTDLSKLPLFEAEMHANPYPIYATLRETDPVHWSDRFNAWIVTRYDEVAAGLNDLRLASDRTAFLKKLANKPQLDRLFAFMMDRMVLTDPPKHTRLRSLVNRAFTPHVIEVMKPHIQQLIDGFIDVVLPHGKMDLVRDFSFPLPATVICEMLGIPAADRDKLHRWADDFVVYFSTHPANITFEQYQKAQKSVEETVAYFDAQMPKLQANPNSLLKLMAAAEEQGSKLSHAEVVANAQLFFIAGHETTANLISNGMIILLRQPEVMAKLRADPSLIPGAVEEFLRFDGPVQFTHRIAREEVTLGGKTIKPGQFVFLFLGAANRDPAHFPEPDRFDITRNPNKHLAFGLGHHYCIGAPLARLETQLAFTTLLKRLKNPRLATDKIEYNDNFNLHGPKSLAMVFDT